MHDVRVRRGTGVTVERANDTLLFVHSYKFPYVVSFFFILVCFQLLSAPASIKYARFANVY